MSGWTVSIEWILSPPRYGWDTVITGTYNFPGTYKITYRVNGGSTHLAII